MNGKVFVTGHRGLVGSAVCRALSQRAGATLLTATRQECDLTDAAQVRQWFQLHRPDYVIHCAGTVGGILANSTRPVDFLRDNALMFLAVLEAAHQSDVRKLLYLG